jgi:serine phosphatase RsbU (regulator of sigma subunit)
MLRARVGPVRASGERLVVNPKLGGAWQLGVFKILAESRCAGGDVGGDFYAFGLREPNRLAVVIGDACGRGAEGAQLLPHVLPLLDQLPSTSGRPSLLLEALNEHLAGRMPSDRFVTGAVLELDAEAGTLTVANAGHVPAMLRSGDGEVTVVGRASGPPLGIVAHHCYLDESYPIASGDVVVFMTDGVLEAIETDLSAMSRLAAVMAQQPGRGSDVHRRLLASLPTYPPERRADDMTLLSLELVAEQPASTSPFQPVS